MHLDYLIWWAAIVVAYAASSIHDNYVILWLYSGIVLPMCHLTVMRNTPAFIQSAAILYMGLHILAETKWNMIHLLRITVIILLTIFGTPFNMIIGFFACYIARPITIQDTASISSLFSLYILTIANAITAMYSYEWNTILDILTLLCVLVANHHTCHLIDDNNQEQDEEEHEPGEQNQIIENHYVV